MPGRWSGPHPKLAGRGWGAQTARDIERWMVRVVRGMSNLQKEPRTPTQIKAGVAAATGTGPAPAMDDHVHDVLTGAPISIQLGAAPAEGTSQALARADHQHGAVDLVAQVRALVSLRVG